MNLDQMMIKWEEDNDINLSDISKIPLEIARLMKIHTTYANLLAKTNICLAKKNQEKNKKYIEKWKFYKDGIIDRPLTKEEIELNPKGKVSVSEAESYILGDKEYAKIYNGVEMLEAQKKFLEDVLGQIKQNTYYINNITQLILHFNGA